MNANKIDAETLLASLDAAQLEQKLRDLDREQAAVRVLLRATRARERHQKPARRQRQVSQHA
jgi:hypothetical protein